MNVITHHHREMPRPSQTQARTGHPCPSGRARVGHPPTKPAVLTHRPGEVSLDNAFSLIEGHPDLRFRVSRLRLAGAPGEENLQGLERSIPVIPTPE